MNDVKGLNFARSIIIIPFCVLTACAPPSQRTTELAENKLMPVEQRPTQTGTLQGKIEQGQAKTISSWEIRGAMAAKNKNKGWSAAMNWVQNGPNNYQIRLMGPLGSGTVLIAKKGNTITYQDGPKQISSHNANELLMQQTGISLPVPNLYYWVRGLSAPGSVPVEHRDQSNHLAQLQQSGYTINFAQYTSVKGIDLPSMIHLQGNGLMMKITIKNWTI